MAVQKEKPNSAVKIRQKKLAKKIVESSGNISISKAMREVGYGEGYARNPQHLTNTKSWQELMEEYLPDDLLAERHRELLNKRDKDADTPETQAVKAGLEMGYKLKGKFAPDQVEHTITTVKIINYGDKDGE